MTIVEKAADELFKALDDAGIVARFTERYCTEWESDEKVKWLIGTHFRKFLIEHWPDVRLLDAPRNSAVQNSVPST